MFEEDDDFEIVETGLIFLGNNRYDLFILYERIDEQGNDFLFGKYEIKKSDYVIGKSSNKEELSRNLSLIARMRNKKMHLFRGALVRMLKYRLYLN